MFYIGFGPQLCVVLQFIGVLESDEAWTLPCLSPVLGGQKLDTPSPTLYCTFCLQKLNRVKGDPRVPGSVLNQAHSWDRHKMRAYPLENNVCVSPVHEAPGYLPEVYPDCSRFCSFSSYIAVSTWATERQKREDRIIFTNKTEQTWWPLAKKWKCTLVLEAFETLKWIMPEFIPITITVFTRMINQ